MLAGAPTPKFPGNRPNHDETRIHIWDRDMKYYSKYLIDLCVPWSGESRLLFERSATGFCLLVNEWNRKSATFIERQRYRFLSNFMSKGYCSSHNETATAWRQRNADWWSDIKKNKSK
jgi:hypothetical protein